jgi:hypothetical protein
MKKAFFSALICALSFCAFAQDNDAKLVAQYAAQANPSISMARKATIEWAKIYDLQTEQVAAALKIQETKYQNFASIESLKTTNPDAYIQKRLTAIDMADNELSLILEGRQKDIFKRLQTEKVQKLEQITAGMKKEGFAEAAITEKLMNFDF